jgi:hypothetical protein
MEEEWLTFTSNTAGTIEDQRVSNALSTCFPIGSTGWVIKLSSTIQRSLSDLEIFDKVLKCLKDLTIYSPMESWITTT